MTERTKRFMRAFRMKLTLFSQKDRIPCDSKEQVEDAIKARLDLEDFVEREFEWMAQIEESLSKTSKNEVPQ